MVSIEKYDFGTTPKGQSVQKYILKNSKGMTVEIITYGGIITNWTAPNKDGKYEDIVLGYNSLNDYIKCSPYFGALVGRYGNRIANGKFSLDGIDYQLTVNDGQNHLHGGDKGFDKVVWSVNEMPLEVNSAALKLTYVSNDGEEGYPGTLATTVIYRLTDNDELEVEYFATTDKKTIVNLTQHTYFNLSGDFSKTILDHEIVLNANQYIPVFESLIPTGEMRDVEGTPFDFRSAKLVGKQINDDNEQLNIGFGYDHSWVLNNQNNGVRKIGSVYHPASGRLLEIETDMPGVQLYTGNFLKGALPNKQGGIYKNRTGLCLETQYFPDSPNHPNFPSSVLQPGTTYKSKTMFKFSVK